MNPEIPPQDPLDRLAWYLDQAFRVPGTRFRFGWDGIIGLVPGVGEAVMLLLQATIILVAVARYHVPPIIALRMILNIFIDTLFGSIPFFGDLFDFAFKSNSRNIALLNQVRAQQNAGQPLSKARHYAFVGAVGLVLVAILGGALFLIFFVLDYLFHLLSA